MEIFTTVYTSECNNQQLSLLFVAQIDTKHACVSCHQNCNPVDGMFLPACLSAKRERLSHHLPSESFDCQMLKMWKSY